jgi:hypothetical protein
VLTDATGAPVTTRIAVKLCIPAADAGIAVHNLQTYVHSGHVVRNGADSRPWRIALDFAQLGGQPLLIQVFETI